MNLYSSNFFADHELVSFFFDRDSGLKAIIAVHNTNLGPASGGCRFLEYANEHEALIDALKLSKGMTYKSAISDIPLGGGKMVVFKTKELNISRDIIYRKIALFIDRLGGYFATGPDVGTDFEDVETMKQFTSFVNPVHTETFTAYGVLNAIKAAVKFQLNKNELTNLKIAVQGLGKTGYPLCKFLHELGAKLYVTDLDKILVEKAVKEFDAIAIDLNSIYKIDVDIFAPCALGGIINEQTINQLKCNIICGSANDQLVDSIFGQVLGAKNILYVPDYVANSGGLISVYYGNKIAIENHSQIFTHIDKMQLTLNNIFTQAQKRSIPTNLIANEMAELKFSGARI